MINNILSFVIMFLQHILYIIEGYLKWLFDIITFKESRLSKKRMIICKKCENYNHGICDKCGCILKAKTRVDFLLDNEGISIDGCPIRKW